MSKGISAKTRFFFSALCFLAVVFCAQGSLFAQTTGTILGSVTDQTDAVLPGAAVMVTNVETGIVRSSVAGDRGAYRVSNLPPGTYEVQASLAGFQTACSQRHHPDHRPGSGCGFCLAGRRRHPTGDGHRRSAPDRNHHIHRQRRGGFAADAGHSPQRAQLHRDGSLASRGNVF